MAKAPQATNVASLDLETLTPKQLKELVEKANIQLEVNVEKRIAALRERIERMCADEGLTINQVLYAGRFGKVEPKYRDPASGKTWSGRGKKPSWLEGNEKEFALG